MVKFIQEQLDVVGGNITIDEAALVSQAMAGNMPAVEKLLLKALAKEEFLLNLASSEYSDLIQTPKLRSRMVTPHFFEQKSGQLKSVSVFSKQARGTMAKWCATNGVTEPKTIQAFTELGYRFIAEKSSENEWIFIR
jgi:cytoplasmic iron level regulating protein YaaA (DUF328/UPF0246 family)